MKQILNGKVYNTETAKCVGEWFNGLSERDFSYCEESLYRKRNGEYFLYGYGGPMTKYAVSVGSNEWKGVEKIIPLEWEDARKWAEEHLEAGEYEAEFGEVEEDDSRVQVHYSISAFADSKAKRDAQKQGVSLSAYIESLIVNAKQDE